MQYLAIVGNKDCRAHAEQTYGTGPGVDAIKTFDTVAEFEEELKRGNHYLVRVVTCGLTEGLHEKVSESVQKHQPQANINRHANLVQTL
jgi:hypothetical protein